MDNVIVPFCLFYPFLALPLSPFSGMMISKLRIKAGGFDFEEGIQSYSL